MSELDMLVENIIAEVRNRNVDTTIFPSTKSVRPNSEAREIIIRVFIKRMIEEFFLAKLSEVK